MEKKGKMGISGKRVVWSIILTILGLVLLLNSIGGNYFSLFNLEKTRLSITHYYWWLFLYALIFQFSISKDIRKDVPLSNLEIKSALKYVLLGGIIGGFLVLPVSPTFNPSPIKVTMIPFFLTFFISYSKTRKIWLAQLLGALSTLFLPIIGMIVYSIVYVWITGKSVVGIKYD